MQLALVHALTGLAHANDEAAEAAPARLVPILKRKAREADECARAVQFGHPLTEAQQQLVAQAQKDITP